MTEEPTPPTSSDTDNEAPPSLRTRVGRMAGLLAFAYVIGLIAVNAVTSPLINNTLLHSVASTIFPRLGSANNIDSESIQQAWDYIQNNYVIRGLPANAGTFNAEQGIITYLQQTYGDRFSRLRTAQENALDQQDISGTRSGGIGLAIEERCSATTLCATNQQPSLLVFEDVLKGMPAEKAGIRNDDVLKTVDGKDVYKLGSNLDADVNPVVNLIIGKPGTNVTVTVLRNGQILSLTATRENLQIPSVYSQAFGHVLYIEITGFDTDTKTAFHDQLAAGLHNGATSVVLDLRENGGGLVDAGQAVASDFLTAGPNEHDVVVRRGRMDSSSNPKSAQNVIHDSILGPPVAAKQPLVVLVNGGSASASEIVTMALRDYHRATIVGEKTYGKGSVQTDFGLPNGDDLHLTIEKWFGPNGESIDGNGINPDDTIVLNSPLNLFRLETSGKDPLVDNQLQAALKLAQ